MTHTHSLCIHAYINTQSIHTHTHTKHSKAKSLAAAKRSRWPSEALGCLDTTQTLRAEPPGGGLVPGLYRAQGDGVGIQSPTWTIPISGHGQQFDRQTDTRTHASKQRKAKSLATTRSQYCKSRLWAVLCPEWWCGHPMDSSFTFAFPVIDFYVPIDVTALCVLFPWVANDSSSGNYEWQKQYYRVLLTCNMSLRYIDHVQYSSAPR